MSRLDASSYRKSDAPAPSGVPVRDRCRGFRAIAYLTNAAVNDVAHDERRDTLLTLARSPTTTTPRASSKAINNCSVIIFYCSCSRQLIAPRALLRLVDVMPGIGGGYGPDQWC